MKRFFFLIAISVAAFTQATAANTDSLLAVFRDDRLADSVRVAAMESAIRSQQGANDERMWALADTLERFGLAKGSVRYEGMGLRFKGIARINQMRFADALVSANQALRLFRSVDDSVYITKALNIVALAFGSTGDRENQVRYLLEALTIAEQLGSTHDVAVTCFNLSAASSVPGAYERAIQYALRTIELVEEQGVKLNIAGVHQNLAGIYFKLGDLEGSREHLMRSRAYNNSGVLVTNYGLEGDLEARLGNTGAAEAAYRKAMELARPGTLDEATAANNLGGFLAGQGRTKEAERLCTQAIALLTRPGTFNAKIKGCECLELVYRSTGDMGRLLQVQDLRKAYEDSITRATVLQEVERYELRKIAVADSVAYVEKIRAAQEAAEAELADERLRKRLSMAGGGLLMVFAVLLWRRLGRTRREKAQSEEILHNVLPEEVAREIRETGTAKSRLIEQVTVLFTDFEDFTQISSTLSHEALMQEVEACFTAFDGLLAQHDIEKVKTIGDAYMAAAGLKSGGTDAAARAVRAALGMQAFVEARHARLTAEGKPSFRMRVGIHTGPVVAGIVGVKKFQYDIWGDTVNTASRMESSGEVGKVNISESTYSLLKDDPHFHFTPRGKVEAKGKGEVEMWFVEKQLELA
jgi:adenylate cyclase